VVDLGEARDVERTSLDAIAAADALVVVEIDDAVGVLHDRAGRRACFQAARILAMHAAVFADQPFQTVALRIYPLGETHHGERFRREIDGIVVDAVVEADPLGPVVPLQTRHLTSLATDAFRYIDQLGDLGLSLFRLRNRGGRTPDQIAFAKFRLDVRGRGRRQFKFEGHRCPLCAA